MTTKDKSKSLTYLPFSESMTLRERVYVFMERYQNSRSIKDMCNILNIEYGRYKDTIKTYKSNWRKGKSKNRQGLKRLNFHNVFFHGMALKSMDAKLAVDCETGWRKTKAKNGMITWKGNDGRVEWFPSTGKIRCWVKKPASVGKMINLLCGAFLRTGVILDYDLFNSWKDDFQLKGFHVTLDTGKVLPYATIKMLKDSNGVIVAIGDKSHPTCMEVQVIYPDWMERNEQLFKQNTQLFNQVITSIQLNSEQILQFSKFMKELATPKTLREDASRMVV